MANKAILRHPKTVASSVAGKPAEFSSLVGAIVGLGQHANVDMGIQCRRLANQVKLLRDDVFQHV